MVNWCIELLLFLQFQLSKFFDINFAATEFNGLKKVFVVGLTLMVVGLLRLIFAKQNYRSYSGIIGKTSVIEGAVPRILRATSAMLFVVAVILMLIALTDPTNLRLDNQRIIKSRERIELIDASVSMCFEYKHSNRSIAEVAREKHIDFIKTRLGSGDRVSLWLFSVSPFKIQDFVLDDEVYMFQVASAPYSISGEQNVAGLSQYINCDEGKIFLADHEGGTNLQRALMSVVQYIKDYGDPSINQRSVLMVTDAAVDTYPGQALEELGKLGIIPYILFIQPNERVLRQTYKIAQINNKNKLLREIERFGGTYFDVNDIDSLEEAYEKINRLEKVYVEDLLIVSGTHLYQSFLVVAACLIVLSFVVAIVVKIIWGSEP